MSPGQVYREIRRASTALRRENGGRYGSLWVPWGAPQETSLFSCGGLLTPLRPSAIFFRSRTRAAADVGEWPYSLTSEQLV